MITLFAGFVVGLSLIAAIGAQNAFVIRQGIRKSHVGKVIATCILSDTILIMVGVGGFGALTKNFPLFEPFTRWGGAIFLIFYGTLSMRSAFFGISALKADGSAEMSAKAAVLTALALTWLNPHVYLDTVVLLGALAVQYGPERWIFGAGAVLASFVFFVVLGYGAAYLQPIFARPFAWRVLDFAVAILMWAIALSLIIP
ncbi:LysE/ArgO family amino acid transporter [Rhodobacteraceae bacterium]|nr:LysE/ArgO family amino acid transporter [Paracoccaceae bacterium]